MEAIEEVVVYSQQSIAGDIQVVDLPFTIEEDIVPT